MTLGLAIAAIGVIWFLGLIWLRILGGGAAPRLSGMAYGLGLVWIMLVIGVLGVTGVPLRRSFGLPLIISLPVIYWLWLTASQVRGLPRRMRERLLEYSRSFTISRDVWWWMALIALVVLWSMIAVRATITPAISSDAWSNYSLKAKAIYIDELVSREVLQWIGTANYPLGVPFQEVWMAWMVGLWDDTAMKTLFPGYLLALWLMAYGTLRERVRPRVAMIGTLFVACLPLVLQHGLDAYTDLPFAYFTLGQAVALVHFVTTGRRESLILGSVFASGLMWIREDGPLVVAAFVAGLIVCLIRVRTGKGRYMQWRSIVVYVIPPVLVWLTWRGIQMAWGISSNVSINWAQQQEIVMRMMIVFEALISGLFLEGNWALLWPIFFLALMHSLGRPWSAEDILFVLPVVTYLLGIYWIAVTTSLFDYVQSGTVLNRLVLHVAPLAALWVPIVYGRRDTTSRF